MTGPAARQPIDLAREKPFPLGQLDIAPGLRQVTVDGGGQQVLEPRVMQVLVALARAEGAIVSRDELIRTCWNGTVVGDDAINRPISLLRRLSEGIGQGSFRIETIPRVGYRLLENPEASDLSAPERRSIKRPLMAAGLAMLLAAVGGLMAWPAAPQGPAYSISLQPFRTAAATSNFNDRLLSELTSHDVPTVGGRRAIMLAGSVDRHGTVNARLVAPGNHAVLWSGAISQPYGGPSGSADAAQIVARITQCALAGANDSRNLAPELFSLYTRTCELGARGQNALGLRVARELTEQAPDFAAGWFALSHHALTLYHSEPHADPTLREEALAAAKRLVSLRPDAQDGYISEALALDPQRRVERERLLRRAAGLEPRYVDRERVSLSEFLLEVGRSREAMEFDRVNAQQSSDQAGANFRLFVSAAATGRWDLSDQALERVSALDASSAPTLHWRWAVWRGDWADAERLLPKGDPAGYQAAIATYRALASGDANRKDVAAAEIMRLPDGCCAPMQAELLTQLGHFAEAIAVLDKLENARSSQMAPINLATFMADPAMRSLWYDPAIGPLLGHIGLIDYWRSSGTRPDLCRGPKAPDFCGLLAD